MALTILPYNDRGPSKSQRMAKELKGAFEKGVEIYGKHEEDKALKEKYGIDLAGIKDPETRSQIIAQELQYGRKMKQAEKSGGINYATGERNTGREPLEIKETKKNLPEFGQVEGKQTATAPSMMNKGPKGSFPQPETEGVVKPLLNSEQLWEKGSQIAQMSRDNGIPMTDAEGYNAAANINEENKHHNASVQQDKARKIATEEKYGETAVNSLRRVMQHPTEEQEALFRKKGEEAAAAGESESEIRKKLAIEARNFKNTIANVKNSIPPNRTFTSIKKSILGTGREAEKERTGIKLKLQPLLKEGLYDTARNLLSELGYHPEERESFISELPEGTNKIMAAFPKIDRPEEAETDFVKKQFQPFKKAEYTPDQIAEIDDTVSNVFKTDPSTNLVLFRKAMEDKGADWEVFKDALDKGILEGSIQLNDDQFNQLDNMDQPPLDNLDKILYKFGLIGR